jgi:Alpha/beta hydrolase domain
MCVVLVAACSSSSTGSRPAASSQPAPQPSATPSLTVQRPAGPAAAISELSGGNGPYIGSANPPVLKAYGYVQQEYSASGTATAYQSSGALAFNGRWTLTPSTTAAYRTRILVRRPAQASAFSGNVIVEWLNVSGGVDSDPEWATLHEEIVRSGDIWVGVSAQSIGVEGGPVAVKVNVPGSDQAGKGLKAIDPQRYGSLQHPGDSYSYDIFTQVARALRVGDALGGVKPQRLIAAGESQSAFATVSYYNGVQPRALAFDGFFVHSRGGVALPIVGSAKSADIASALSGKPTIFRTDQSAPVMDIQTETDVASLLDSYVARQPDTDRFRLWEVAGTAHADVHLVGANATSFGCGFPINNGPMHIVAKAAYHALKIWLTAGRAPVIAPRIDVAPGASPQIRRNAEGIALGGIRTPPVDVPVATLSGAPSPNPSTICLLVGSTKPFTAAQLAKLYPARADYLKRYDADADAAVKEGFVLPQDRPALLAFAEPQMIAG